MATPTSPLCSMFYDDVPTSNSLLMQCGYRNKVCTNHRATKLDGTLHKLCEFHRRKANLNQQRLHKRQREKRARIESQSDAYETDKIHASKRTRPNLELIEPIVFSLQQFTPIVDASAFPKIGSADMDILELLLLDMQPQTFPPLQSSISVDDKNSIAV